MTETKAVAAIMWLVYLCALDEDDPASDSLVKICARQTNAQGLALAHAKNKWSDWDLVLVGDIVRTVPERVMVAYVEPWEVDCR